MEKVPLINFELMELNAEIEILVLKKLYNGTDESLSSPAQPPVKINVWRDGQQPGATATSQPADTQIK